MVQTLHSGPSGRPGNGLQPIKCSKKISILKVFRVIFKNKDFYFDSQG